MWMLGQERSRAEETTNARILRGPVLGVFPEQQDGPQRPGTQGLGEGQGRQRDRWITQGL